MRAILRPVAAADIEDASRWYRKQRDILATEFLAAVRQAIQRVIEQPSAYPVVHRDIRRIRLRRFPYSLFYRLYPDVVVVVGCLHARRDPRRWQSRRDG